MEVAQGVNAALLKGERKLCKDAPEKTEYYGAINKMV